MSRWWAGWFVAGGLLVGWPLALAEEAPAPIAFLPGAGVNGDQVACPGCDVTGVRNIQGGTTEEPNLDIGAGSATDRGALSLNFDVGKTVLIYDGHRKLVARFDGGGIVFYSKPHVR